MKTRCCLPQANLPSLRCRVLVASDYPYHYLGSVRTMLRIGDALANAALDLDPKQTRASTP